MPDLPTGIVTFLFTDHAAPRWAPTRWSPTCWVSSLASSGTSTTPDGAPFG